MCLYCENKKDNKHFSCLNCGFGMCEDCYLSDVEHTGHLFDYHEAIEDEEFYKFIKSVVIIPYGYLCYNCLNNLWEGFKNFKKEDIKQKNKGGINKKW